MIPALVLLGSMTVADAHLLDQRVKEYQESVLAPFPVYPLSGVFGAPKASRVTVEGKEYIIIWDGNALTIHPADGFWPDGERDQRMNVGEEKVLKASKEGNGHEKDWIGKIKDLLYIFYSEGTWAIKKAKTNILDGLLKIPPEKPPNGNGDKGENWSKD